MVCCNIYKDFRDTILFLIIDLLTVSETAIHPPEAPEDNKASNINSPRNLSMEATYINHNFSQQVGSHIRFVITIAQMLTIYVVISMCWALLSQPNQKSGYSWIRSDRSTLSTNNAP